jgi:hypothetical protein
MRIGTIGRNAARILLITVVFVLMMGPTACSESQSGTSVSIVMADREVKQGESFTVEVRISTDTPCRGAQCVLSFDPSLMRCDSVGEGEFFKGWATANGASTIMIPQSPNIDNALGHVPVTGIAIFGGGERGPKGSGVLFTYHFTALADGTASLTLSDVVVIDVSGQAIAEVEVNN